MTALTSPIKTPDAVQAVFDAHGVRASTLQHRPVFTVAEGLDIKSVIPGGHTKNLFLRDKADALWLVTALWETEIDLKKLAAHLGAGRFSFGKPETMQEKLCVTPGSVTPLALFFNKEQDVSPVLDAALFSHAVINCHPLQNDMTTSLSPQDLRMMLEKSGFTPRVVDFKTL